MDPATLGAMAVSIVAPYLTEAGKAAAAKIGETASGQVENLLATLRRKFGTDQDPYAGQTLARLEQQPDAETRKRALADVVAEKADADPAFKEELAGVVEAARTSPGTMQFLTQVYGGQVGEILNIGSVQTLNIGRRETST
jgi:hypothetical protein